MAKIVVPIELDGRNVVFAEVDVQDSDQYLGTEDALAPIAQGDRLSGVAVSVKAAIEEVIRPAVETLVQIRQTVQPPTSLELEFGLKLSGRTGLVFASSQLDGHIKVKLTWAQ